MSNKPADKSGILFRYDPKEWEKETGWTFPDKPTFNTDWKCCVKDDVVAGIPVFILQVNSEGIVAAGETLGSPFLDSKGVRWVSVSLRRKNVPVEILDKTSFINYNKLKHVETCCWLNQKQAMMLGGLTK